MANPFDDNEASFVILKNEEEQHSLWPADLKSPEGWTVAFGPAGRPDCLNFVEENWTDMRPKSLVTARSAF